MLKISYCKTWLLYFKNCTVAGFIIFTVLNERLVEKYLKNEVKYGEIVDKLVKLFKHNDLLKKSKTNKNIEVYLIQLTMLRK